MTTFHDARARGTTRDDAFAIFDALPPVSLAELTGTWRGSGFATGHPLDGLLESFGWYGKAFRDPEHVHPLLFGAEGEVVAIDPASLPLRTATKLHFKGARLASGLFRVGKRLVETTEPAARLRMMEYRGQVSATMIYDALPILDVFRRADARTLLGAMDYRYFEHPFFFVLEQV